MELYAIVSVLLGGSSASTYAPTYAYCPLVLCEGLRQLTQAKPLRIQLAYVCVMYLKPIWTSLTKNC